jgi:DNA polymerase-1
LRRQFDPSCEDAAPIYNDNNEWNDKRFESWLARSCNHPRCERPPVVAWPRLPSGKLALDSDAFKLMYHVPGIEGLHALRDVVGFINKASLPISSDGRNHPSLFPFGTATGRNAHAKSPFNTHAGMRSFIKFPADKIGCYLDWRTQEVGIHAGSSGCEALQAAYRSGDVYHHFARSFGVTADPDHKRWKANNPKAREQMKRLVLAISYGMGIRSLAKGMDRHPLIASNIMWNHRQIYARSWEYREQRLELAMLERQITTPYGWRLQISHSPNKRTIYNFPQQGGGAEMLRLSVLDLCDNGLPPSMLIHDGILFEFDSLEQIAAAREIMEKAGPLVCNFKIDADIDQTRVGGERFRDKRDVAKHMWATMIETLVAIGAISPRKTGSY